MTGPTLSPSLDPKEVVQGVKVVEEQAKKLVAEVGKMSKAFDDFGEGLAKKARPGLDALKSATVGTVSEMVKQLDYLTTANDKLAKDVIRAQGQVVEAYSSSTKKVQSVVRSHYATLDSLMNDSVALAKQKAALMLGSDVIATQSKRVQAEVIGHYDALGNIQRVAVAKARGDTALMLGSDTIATQSKRVQAEVIGHYDALGNIQRVAVAKARGDAALMLGSDVIATQSKRVQAEVKGHYDALGTFQQEAVVKARLLNADLISTARTHSSQAVGSAQGDYSVLGGANHKELVRVTKELDHSHKSLNQTITDAKFAFRGLAGSVGQVYLSYGSLLPLLAGAAVGGAMVSVVKIGAEVDNTLRTIQVLSQESAGSVGALTAQMLELARSGPFGPLEVAEAMKTMSLAGLTAIEVGAGIRDVLNFAIAGNTSIKVAADVLTSVSTAFKMGVESYSYVADVIAKTAAVSKSSVESIGEAFKTASVINSQYGVSLRDVGLGMAVLSNVGIQGTAAGTSLRNAYKDLLHPTEKAAKAMKALGIDARDAYGNVKPFVEIIKQAEAGAAKLGVTAGSAALATVFSERGAKGPIEAIALLKEKAREAGTTVGNMLLEVQAKALDSAGFVMDAAAQLSLTPLNQMRSVKATLEASMVEAFQSVAPVILELSTRLKGIFNSEEFKTAIQNLAIGFGNVALFLTENIVIIGKLVGAYTVLKIAMGMGAFLRVLATEVALVGTAMQTAAVGAGVLQGAFLGAGAAGAAKAGTLLTLGRFLPMVGTAITAVTAAVSLYSVFTARATATNKAAAADTTLLEFYRKQREGLEEANTALALNISLEELRGRKKQEEQITSMRSDASKAVAKAEADLADANTKLRSLQDSGAAGAFLLVPGAERGLANAKYALQAAKDLQTQSESGITTLKTETALERERALALNQTNALLTEMRANARKSSTLQDEVPSIDKGKHNSALKESTTALTTEIKLLKLEQGNADREFANTDAINKRNAAIRGFSTEMEAASVHIAAAAKADSQYAIDVLGAVNTANATLNNPKSTQGAVEQARESLGLAIEELKVKREQTLDAATRAEQEAGTARTLRVSLDIANRESAAMTEAEASRQDMVKLAKADLELSVIGKNMTVSQVAEATRLAAIEEASQVFAYESMTAQVALQRELNRLVETKATDISYEAQQAGLKYLDAFNVAVRKRDMALAVADKQAAITTKTEYQKTFDAIGGVLADALITGGAEGAKKVGDYLREELLRKPFKMIIQGIMSPITGQLTQMASGMGEAAAGAGGAGNLLGAASSLSKVYDTITKGFAGVGTGVTSTLNSFAVSGMGQSMGLSTAVEAMGPAMEGALAPTINVITSNAAAVTAAAGSVATIAAGVGVGTMIAGDKTLGGVNGLGWSAIGAVVGSFIPVVGTVIGAVIGGVIDAAFGHGPTQVQGQGTRGTFGANGQFSGQNYTNLHQDGGWFTSDKNWTNTSAVDSKTVNSWQNAFIGVKNSVSSMAASMGLATDKIASYTKYIDVAAGTTAEQVTALFTSMADDMARAAAPGITELAKEGESASTTLSRLGTSLATVNQYLGLLDHTLMATSLSGADAASKLADVFGGLDQFAASTKAYYDTYFSEAERLYQTTSNVAKGLALVGVAMPATKEAFRAVVTGLDLTSDAGRNTYAVMMALAPEFATVADAASASLKQVFDTFKKSVEDLMGSLQSARDGVASAKAGMTLTRPRSVAEISTAVTAALPTGTAAAKAALDAANAAAVQPGKDLATTQGLLNQAVKLKADKVDTAQIALNDTIAKYKDLSAQFASIVASVGGTAWGSNGAQAYDFNTTTNRINNWSNASWPSQGAKDAAMNALRGPNYTSTRTTLATSIIGQLSGEGGAVAANTVLATAEKALADARASGVKEIAAYQKAVDTAKVAQNAAVAAVKIAEDAYGAALTKYVADMGKSTQALTKLKDETVAYYEAQKALAEGMATSASSLRGAATAAQFGALSTSQSLAQQQADFAKNYSLGLATTGGIKAAYADKLTAALPTLASALADTAATRSDWVMAMATLASQSNALADQLDAEVSAANYQADSLALLGTIDTALANMQSDAATISQAVNAGADLTAQGLRAVVKQLGGVPAFAGGGYHTGGARWVGENGPELEITGPSRIYNTSQLHSMGDSGNTQRLEQLVQELTAEVANLRIEARATASNTNKIAQLADRTYTEDSGEF